MSQAIIGIREEAFVEDILVRKSQRKARKRNPVLIDINKKIAPKLLSPSEYAQKMSLSSTEYYRQICRFFNPEVLAINTNAPSTLLKNSSVNVDIPLVQPFPTELVFQNYIPNTSYELPLTLRNLDKSDTPYFTLSSTNNNVSRIAAGLSLTFIVKFTPDAAKDYHHELTCVTDREVFAIPVYCIGPRAILDLPDEITFDDTPVKHTSSKLIRIQNVGQAAANASIEVPRKFQADPNILLIHPGDYTTVSLQFCPSECEAIKEQLIVKFDTGERIRVQLQGMGITAPTTLSTDKVVVGSAFIGLDCVQSFKVMNNSSVPINYKWSPFSDETEERRCEALLLDLLNGSSGESCSDLEKKLTFWLRTSTDEETPCPPGLNGAEHIPFRLDPHKGRIRPGCSQEITVWFNPREAKLFSETLYCELTGLTERLPLIVEGTGLGPKVQFSFSCLDLGRLFIGARHSYEMVLSNVGCIDALFSWRAPLLNPFAACFTATPDDGLITPGSYQSVQIEFCSPSRLGAFDLSFEIWFDGCPKPDYLQFRGTVVGPTFHFNTHKLDFGEVSYGFSSSRQIRLENTSLIPMRFRLRILTDTATPQQDTTTSTTASCAQEPSPIESSTDSALEKTSLADGTPQMQPDLFLIQPMAGSLQAMSSMEILVRCSPKQLGTHRYAIAVDIDGVGGELYTLPVLIQCICPKILITPDSVNLRRCFLRHPYLINFTLQNKSSQPASYAVIMDLGAEGEEPDEATALLGLQYASPQPKGQVPASGQSVLPVNFKAHELGELDTVLRIGICGLPQAVLTVPIVCCGEGPVLYIEPTTLNWGTIPVLQPTPRTVKLTNESVIPAQFTARMTNTDSIFRVEPCTGYIAALGQLDLQLIAQPDDVITFNDQMELMVTDTIDARHIELTASGYGGTIVVEPNLSGSVQLGPYFSATPVNCKFRLINKGRRQQQLIWSIDGNTVRRSSQASMMLSERDSEWEITPHRFDINPGSSMEITLTVACEKPQTVRRRIFCHTILGRKGAKTLIRTVDVTVNFIAPDVHLSHQELVYRVEKAPKDCLQPQVQQFSLRNDSALDLTSRLELAHPFQLLIDGECLSENTIKLQSGASTEVQVQFDPAYKDDFHSRRVDELLFITYTEHPNQNAVRLVGEVHFPNVSFDSDAVRFGYILNHTEVTRHLLITNTSPLTVRFRWTFLVGERANIVFRRQTRLQHLTPDPTASGRTEEELEMILEHPTSPPLALKSSEQGKEVHTEPTPMCTEFTNLGEASDLVPEAFEDPFPIEMDTETGDYTTEENDHFETQESSTPFVTPEQRNDVLEGLLDRDNDVIPLGIEEIFDITPLYGEILPGATQSVSVVFYGHADIEASVTATCDVEGGPVYEMEITGGASNIDYVIEQTELEFTSVRYDRPAVGEVLLMNTGQVDFEFSISPANPIDLEPASDDLVEGEEMNEVGIISGQLTAEPAMGYLPAGENCSIRIAYLARKPEWFEKHLHIQIAHFEPKLIVVRGMADFARIILDLPRVHETDRFLTMNEIPSIPGHARRMTSIGANHKPDATMLQSACFDNAMTQLLKTLRSKVTSTLQEAEAGGQAQLICPCVSSTRTSRVQRSTTFTTERSCLGRVDLDPIFTHESDCIVHQALLHALQQSPLTGRHLTEFLGQRVPDFMLQLEAERCHLCALLDRRATELGLRTKALMGAEAHGTTRAENEEKPANSNSFSRLRLPGYRLDFGVVVHSSVVRRLMRSANPVQEPVSFRFEPASLQRANQLGFHPSIQRIRHLPGPPQHEWVTWEVAFDPKGANLPPGLVETELIIYILHGPCLPLWLQATVVIPTIQPHVNSLDFGAVQYGEARLMPVQLENPTPIRVHWSYATQPAVSLATQSVDRFGRSGKVGSQWRRNRAAVKQPPVFELIPRDGILEPGAKCNIQVKFAPLEKRHYEQRVLIELADSTESVTLACRGDGLEPQLEWDQAFIQFDPCLPFSQGGEKIITVSNPCDFAVEFYSVEKDMFVHREDQIVRSLGAFDEYGQLLLPPRKPGENLPSELTVFFDENMRSGREKMDSQFDDLTTAVRPLSVESLEVGPNGQEYMSLTQADQSPAFSTYRQAFDGRSTTTGFLAATLNADACPSSLNAHDITPVSLALARYLGIDLSQADSRTVTGRKGIFLVVHGPLEAIRQPIVSDLSERYDATVLTLDQIVLEALVTSSSDAAQRARDCCTFAGYNHIQNERIAATEANETDGQVVLDNELGVIAPTESEEKVDGMESEQNKALGRAKKISTVVATISKEPTHGADSIGPGRTESVQVEPIQHGRTSTVNRTGEQQAAHGKPGASGAKRMSTQLEPAPEPKRSFSPPAMGPPVSRRISMTGFMQSGAPLISFVSPIIEEPDETESGEHSAIVANTCMYSTILPDETLVSLIAERIANMDCHKGVVLNGLDSQFTDDRQKSAQLVLKAVQDRRHMYFISVKSDYTEWKTLDEQLDAVETAAKLAMEAQRQERAEEMSELEYLQLESEQREEIDELLVRSRRLKRQVDLERKRIQEELEREQREAEERRLEHERFNKNRGKKGVDKSLRVPSSTKVGGPSSARGDTERTQKVASLGEKLEVDHNLIRHQAGSPVSRRTSRAIDPRRKSGGSLKEEALAEEDEAATMSEEEQLIYQRFKTFHLEFAPICDLLSYWDRVALLRRQPTGIEDRDEPTSPPGRKHRPNQSTAVPPSYLRTGRRSGNKADGAAGVDGGFQGDMCISPMMPIYCDREVGKVAATGSEKPLLVGRGNEPVLGATLTGRTDISSKQSITCGVPHLVFHAQLSSIRNVIQSSKREAQLVRAVNDSLKVIQPNPTDTWSERLQPSTGSEVHADVKRFATQLLLPHLPDPDEIMDYLGLGRKGPAIPNPINLSVVRYPAERAPVFKSHQNTTTANTSRRPIQSQKSKGEKSRHKPRADPNGRVARFHVATTGIDGRDIDAVTEEEEEMDAHVRNVRYFQFYPSGFGDPILPEMKTTDTGSTITEDKSTELQFATSKSRASIMSRSRKATGDGAPNTARKKSSLSRTRRLQPFGSQTTGAGAPLSGRVSPFQIPGVPEMQTPASDESSSLNHYRWIVPAKGQVQLRLRFQSDRVGQFDQIFNFELLGTRRIYQLYCRGIAALPTLSREPRLIFPRRKRCAVSDQIVPKTYVFDTATFEFGPLLIEKTKERVLEGYYPENRAIFKLFNTSPIEAELRLGFLNDAMEEGFGVEPKRLILPPGSSREITVWAYPRAAKRCEDVLVCTARDNPEPTMLKIACDGALPELELDKKVFNFDKVILQRKDVRSITLRNPTLLPVQWKLSGVDALGEEFSVPQDAGIVEPHAEFVLYAYFRAMKPFKAGQKKNLRLEVYDMEYVAGLIQAETIQVIAEAYDVALDISFPKGSDGGIDFGLIKVGEEIRQAITLKNKGPYEIAVNFLFEASKQSKVHPNSAFTITPDRVHLSSSEKAVIATLTFCAKCEFQIKDEAIIQCQVIEPSVKDQPELIASIPIRVSARAVYSNFVISPSKEINFGAVVVQHRKTRQLVIENHGEQEFRFSIVRMSKMVEIVSAKDTITSKPKVTDQVLLSAPQAKLQTGLFTITPAGGSVPPGNAQLIIIDCLVDSPGFSDEELAIEISDRDMLTYKYGIPYRLQAEGHIPSVETEDLGTIFEEHRVCRDLSLAQTPQCLEQSFSGGVYGTEENRFLFTSVLVGSRARARFCIANRGKVPAEVSFELRTSGGGSTTPNSPRRGRNVSTANTVESFELEQDRAVIEPHSCFYVNVTFVPTAMQKYNAFFRAYLENVNPTQTSGAASSGRGSSTPGAPRSVTMAPVLAFGLSGEGFLPRLSVLQPTRRSKQGHVLCVFTRIQLGRRAMQLLVLKNTGILNSRINMILTDSDGVFRLEPSESSEALLFLDSTVAPPGSSLSWEIDRSVSGADYTVASQFHTAGLLLRPEQEIKFQLFYCPCRAGMKSLGQLRLQIVNNPYEDTVVDLIGETLTETVCIHDIPELESTRATSIREALRRSASATKNSDEPQRTELVDVDAKWDEMLIKQGLQHNHLNFGDVPPTDSVSHTFTLTHCASMDACGLTDQSPASYRYAWPTNNANLVFQPAEGHLHPGQSRRITVTFRPNQTSIKWQAMAIQCNLIPIRVPIAEGCTQPTEWDDTKQVIRWVDAPIDRRKTQCDSGSRSSGVNSRLTLPSRDGQNATSPTDFNVESGVQEYAGRTEVIRRKQKLIEVEPEPKYEVIQSSETDARPPLNLLVSAVSKYAEYACDADSIQFRETLMFQRRVFRFELRNTGLITMQYRWNIEMMMNQDERMLTDNEDAIIDDTVKDNRVDASTVPFLVNPTEGSILPGKLAYIEVTFSPLSPGRFSAKLQASIPHLRESSGSGSQSSTKAGGPVVLLDGTSQQPFIHFDLHESDYLSGIRRNPELPGPQGSPIGTPLDSATRVIELCNVGIGTKSNKRFFVVNLTTEEQEFTIRNEDPQSLKYRPLVKCITTKGKIPSGGQTELCFEHTSTQLGIGESFWRLELDQLQFSVPLLVVAQTRESHITLDRSHLHLGKVLVGHTTRGLVHLINRELEDGEEKAVEFRFKDSSRFGAGRQDVVHVEPMSGTLRAGESCPIQLTFTATGEQQMNINLICKIKHQELPLTFNLKADGYTMSAMVCMDSLEDQPSTQHPLASLWSPCTGDEVCQLASEAAQRVRNHVPKYEDRLGLLNFGSIDPGECVTRTLSVTNCGQFQYDYAWSLAPLRPDRNSVLDSTEGLSVKQSKLIDRLINGDPLAGLDAVIRITPTHGSLKPGESVTCGVSFAPPKQMKHLGVNRIQLDGLIVLCLAIREGPAYGIVLQGETNRPAIHLSATLIDFGTHLVTRPGLAVPKQRLRIINRDTIRSVSVTCLTENSDTFQHDTVPTVLQAQPRGAKNGFDVVESELSLRTDIMDVWIYFTPKAFRAYTERLQFEVNGSTWYTVTVQGQGTEMRLHTDPGPLTVIRRGENGKDQLDKCSTTTIVSANNMIDLGKLRIGQRSRRFIALINRSAAPIHVHGVWTNPLTGPRQSPLDHTEQVSRLTLEHCESPFTVRLCDPRALDRANSLTPVSSLETPVKLEPRGGQTLVEVQFESHTRLETLLEEVVCEVSTAIERSSGGVSSSEQRDETNETRLYLPVFTVRGTYEQHVIGFDRDSVNFGPVVCGGQLTKRLVMTNSGDFGSRFRWDDKPFSSLLTITPLEGYIAPNTNVSFDVTLKPTILAQDIRMENVSCHLDECNNSLPVIITGMCVPPTIVKEALNFIAPVRQQEVRNLQVVNRTNAQWQLRPVFDGPEWSGAQLFVVRPQETGQYAVTYKPLTMTTQSGRHKGSVFFPLPDGTGLLYQLFGTADPPKPLGKVIHDIECKRSHTETIRVPNWLGSAQRFQVQLTVTRPEKPDPAIQVSGLPYVDVPADGSREYKFTFLSYREGTIQVRATFLNNSSGEYHFYEVQFKASRPKSLAVVQMRTPVRRPTTHTVEIGNPLDIPIGLALTTNLPEVKCPQQLQVPPGCMGSVTLEYLPLCVGPQKGKLDASCNELGVFSYELDLEATPAANELEMRFSSSVGQRHVRTVRFTNYFRSKTEFQAKIDNTDFQCDKLTNAAAGVEVSVDVAFEPTSVGEVLGRLIVTSNQAGDYVFPLRGQATEPQPQGPISIRSGETSHVPFRNVFTSSMLYTFQVDNNAFHLPKNSEVIRSRKECRIAIGLDAHVISGMTAPVTGKLIVTCVRAEISAKTRGAASRTGTDSGSNTSSWRKPEAGEGMQWVYYLRGLPTASTSSS